MLTDIAFRYRVPADGLPGATYITTVNNAACDLQVDNDATIARARIDIQPYTDWWTQPDSRRSAFESCYPGETSYTCSKRFDVGETITHELGHTTRLSHPGDVGGDAAADCTDVNIRSTMCPGRAQWETARRTPTSYDRNSARFTYEERND